MAAVTERGLRIFGSHDEHGRWARGTDDRGNTVFRSALVSVHAQSKIAAKTALVPGLVTLKHRHRKKRR